MIRVAIIISPNWRDYAKKYLADCLESLVAQDYIGEVKYFFIDNESTVQSYRDFEEMISQALPQNFSREIIAIPHNAGFAEGNNRAMRLAIDQNFTHLLLLNIDTVCQPTMLSELLSVLESSKEIGAVQPSLMLWPEKEKINSLGNATHFLGFGYCIGYGINENKQKVIGIVDKMFYPSGAAVLFKANVLNLVGLFDEEFWMYAEDQDLGWRIWLAGFSCVLAEKSVVYHKYEFSRSIQKYYWMDRNRILVILKNYKLPTLLLILPALIVMEFGMLYFSIKNGSFAQKILVYKYFLKKSTWKYVASSRAISQSIRRVSDQSLVGLFSSSIEYQEIMSPALMVANKIFTLYWRMVRRLIVW